MADLRRDVERRQQQAGGGSERRGADAEAQAVDMLDVDAHQPGALAFAGNRADRAAEIGAADQEPEQGGDGQRRAEGDGTRHRDQRHADVDDVEAVGHVDRAGVRPPEIERQVIHDDRQAQRDQQDVLVAAMRRMLDDAALQHVAQHEEGGHRDRQRQIRVDAEAGIEEIDAVQRDHQDRAVGEVDDVQHAVDQRKAERHQRVDRAGGQPVDQGRYQQ